MGFPKYYLGRPRPAPPWAATVGAMRAHRTHVKGLCQVCDFRADPLDLDLIISVKGEDFSLFDVLAKCPACGNGVRFFYKPGGDHGTPYRPCMT